MKNKKKIEGILRTGDVFTAVDTLNRTFDYEFLGFDANDLLEGIGCRYVVLKNLTSNTITEVEAAWFHERTITRKERP